MNLDRTEIESWGKRYDSKGEFPRLISKLIFETTPKNTILEIPSGSAVFLDGWDGKVTCSEDTGFVPSGNSLWEFKTNGGKTEADTDYDKRKDDPLGCNPSESVFIFVTTGYWKNKEDWVEARQEEEFWKEVRVYDCINLVNWLDNTSVTFRWFLSQLGRQADHLLTTEEFWEEWSIGPKGQLTPKVITSGREYESQELINFLSDEADFKFVRGSTKDEAVAFAIASVLQTQTHDSESLKSKTLILEDKLSFRSLKRNNGNLILIANFDEFKIVYSAVHHGHHVIIPVGPEDSINNNILDLPRIERDGQIDALVEMGLSKEDATKYSKESGRNVTILKSQLGFPLSKQKWMYEDEASELIPALLIGRWDESKKGDRDILTTFSNEDYEIYSEKLLKWLEVEVPPIMKIGSTWRLTSPLDAWTNLSNLIKDSDLAELRSQFLEVYKEIDPVFDLAPEERKMASLKGKESSYSDWCRQGLIQSVILIALYGENLRLRNDIDHQNWADSIVENLLSTASAELWASRNNEMPLIAEASPDSFLNSVRNSLSEKDQPVMNMFIEEEGLLSKTSRHTGLLWALENLAWEPEYLLHTSLTLAKLVEKDPGGHLTNRPFNSLVEIFKPWHYQTFASYEKRMDVIEEIIKNNYEVGWSLLINLLPDPHETAHPTHKMRWRLFEKSYDIKYTHQEIWNTYSQITKLLLKYLDYSEFKIAKLIEKSTSPGITYKYRESILSNIESNISEVNQKDFSAWHKLRKILSKHRTHPDTDWALQENILNHYEKLYKNLEPDDLLEKNIWLFNERYPKLIEGNKREDISNGKLKKKIENKRIAGLKAIFKKVGVEGLKSLSKEVQEPWILGSTLANIVNDEEVLSSLLGLLKKGEKEREFIQGFIYAKSTKFGNKWIFELYEKLDKTNFEDYHLAQLFIPLDQNLEVWEFIEETTSKLKKEYWKNMNPIFYNKPIKEKLYGIEKLLIVDRYTSAVRICSHSSNEIPSEKLIEILKKAATKKSEEDIRLEGYEINEIFETLDKREEIDESILVNIEWLYLPLLANRGSIRKPKLIHRELATNPEFFIEVLSWIYKSEKEESEREQDATEEQLKRRAKLTHDLLYSWKTIPGMVNSENLSYDSLISWIKSVRAFAEKKGYLEMADLHIGKVLAQYPEEAIPWPSNEICKIIESINTQSLKSGFSTATFNKRGASTRGPFEGGNIERDQAEYFHNQANMHKDEFPNTAEILEQLANNYEKEAEEMDKRAERSKLDH